MDKASEAILALKPVASATRKKLTDGHTAIWLDRRGCGKGESGSSSARQRGKTLQCALRAVNAMLLNEFLKEHKAFVEEHHNVEKLQVTVAQQQKQIEALTAGLQKVSAQLEVSKAEPQTVLNND